MSSLTVFGLLCLTVSTQPDIRWAQAAHELRPVWFASNPAMSLGLNLPPSGRRIYKTPELTPRVTYTITLKTSEYFDAGTDAKVYIKLKGLKGTTGCIYLIDEHKTAFKPGKVDMFTAKAKDVGMPSSIEIGHDNTGPNPAWGLDYVEVLQVIAPNEYSSDTIHVNSRFDYYEWVDAALVDKPPVREIPVTTIDITLS
ncbi:lipoxygenase homology domain-containing protein 1-like [Physella acuta]|uniref:lipoxygenase homology domain-containing protein 1-like n=1 Tax=Physella acuta TaxID=109671 RepID=UPI0027DB32BA|nr:lipoxygenase homology domain-containing protein 1-like [Physella acuta]